MTRFWQRRLAVISIVLGAVMTVLFVIPFTFSSITTPRIGLAGGGAGALALIIGIITFFATHPEDIQDNARLDYIMIIVAITVLIYTTGLFSSPFAILWGAAALVAPMFGGWGIIPVLFIAFGLPAVSVLTGNLQLNHAWQPALIAASPVVFGFFIKPTNDKKSAETEEDRSYHALARELGQVASKSEVVINAIGEGVIAVNGQGVIDVINPAAQQLVGWGEGDAVGLSYKSILHLVDSRGNDVDSAHDPVAQTFSSNKTTGPGEYLLKTQSDKDIAVSVLVSPTGQPGSGAIIVFRNVSHERAEERQQAEFISTASHEMRTPVASIEGYLGLALNPQTATVDDKARDYITKAHAAAEHLGRLFQDLLDVSKAEDGRMQNNPKVVDITKFVSDITEGLRPKAEQKGLRLTFKPYVGTGAMHEKGVGRTVAPVFYVNVDNDHLREVADNLIENAIKYTPSGEVTVDITGTDQLVTFSVTDTGLGIPREDQIHLFQKFYRVDNTETREIGGTGLGLYLCRRLVEAMNGRIWVESTYKKGSTFYVELPRTSSIEATAIVQQAEQKAAAPSHSEPLETPTLDLPQTNTPVGQVNPAPSPSIVPPDDLLKALSGQTTIPKADTDTAIISSLNDSTELEVALANIPDVVPALAQTPLNAAAPMPTPIAPAPQPVITEQPTPAVQPASTPVPSTPTIPLHGAVDYRQEPVLAEIPDAPEEPSNHNDIPHPIDDFPNVQLSAIEKDPDRYIEQTVDRALNIPKRNE